MADTFEDKPSDLEISGPKRSVLLISTAGMALILISQFLALFDNPSIGNYVAIVGFLIAIVCTVFSLVLAGRRIFTLTDKGIEPLGGQMIPWSSLSEVRIEATRPRWLFLFCPVRVLIFRTTGNEDLIDFLPLRQRRRGKAIVKKWGTPLVFSEQGTATSFPAIVQTAHRLGSLDCAITAGTPKEKVQRPYWGPLAIIGLAITFGTFTGVISSDVHHWGVFAAVIGFELLACIYMLVMAWRQLKKILA